MGEFGVFASHAVPLYVSTCPLDLVEGSAIAPVSDAVTLCGFPLVIPACVAPVDALLRIVDRSDIVFCLPPSAVYTPPDCTGLVLPCVGVASVVTVTPEMALST